MKGKNQKLMIEGNAIYEIDLDCMMRKQNMTQPKKESSGKLKERKQKK